MVIAVSGLEWTERLTERLQSHGPGTERGNLGQGRGREGERERNPRTQNAECGGLLKHQVRHVKCKCTRL